MLQKSLNGVFYQTSSQWLAIQPDRHLADPAAGVATLHLRRQPFPIEYVSPLPLQLAAALEQPVREVTLLVVEGLGREWSTPFSKSPLSSQERSVLQGVVLLPDASGQLGLQLDSAGLMLWLKLLVTLPWPQGQLSYQPCQTLAVPSPLSQRLHLSPLALVQHTYARCSSLAADLSSDSASARAEARPDLGASDANSAVIWALADLVDTLAAVGVPPTALLQRGCFLSEAVYEWLRAFYRERSENPALTGLILQAVQQSLQHLLEQRLGYHAPAAL
ncbi:MAG: hypothetical protein ICV62_16960 [Cyanobacteria bacterium Co-bin13]|nr:hypothetical protein [Cyanobacteria bacterium Co-bin13]